MFFAAQLKISLLNVLMPDLALNVPKLLHALFERSSSRARGVNESDTEHTGKKETRRARRERTNAGLAKSASSKTESSCLTQTRRLSRRLYKHGVLFLAESAPWTPTDSHLARSRYVRCVDPDLERLSLSLSFLLQRLPRVRKNSASLELFSWSTSLLPLLDAPISIFTDADVSN